MDPAATLSASSSSAEASRSQVRVLLVDDDRDLVKALSLCLRKSGFQVSTAPDGQAGLAAIQRERPDLVVLDVMMSHQDGFQVCAELRRGKAGYCPKIIILSAITQGTNRTEEACRLQSGADAFMSKPFDAKRLIAEIEHLLSLQ